MEEAVEHWSGKKIVQIFKQYFVLLLVRQVHDVPYMLLHNDRIDRPIIISVSGCSCITEAASCWIVACYLCMVRLGNITILPWMDDIKCHDNRYQRNFLIPKYHYRDIIVNIVEIARFVIQNTEELLTSLKALIIFSCFNIIYYNKL